MNITIYVGTDEGAKAKRLEKFLLDYPRQAVSISETSVSAWARGGEQPFHYSALQFSGFIVDDLGHSLHHSFVNAMWNNLITVGLEMEGCHLMATTHRKGVLTGLARVLSNSEWRDVGHVGFMMGLSDYHNLVTPRVIRLEAGCDDMIFDGLAILRAINTDIEMR